MHRSDELIKEAKKLLIKSTFGSCTCLTKSPTPEHHGKECVYRKILKALDELKGI